MVLEARGDSDDAEEMRRKSLESWRQLVVPDRVVGIERSLDRHEAEKLFRIARLPR